jgi:ankyrin repeat protein
MAMRSVLVLLAAVAALAGDVRVADAAKRGDSASVRELLRSGADVNGAQPDGTTALHWAAQNYDLSMADALLAGGANPNAANRYGVTPLYFACINGSGALVEKLVSAGADPNGTLLEGQTPLLTASKAGSVGAVGALLKSGAAVDAKEDWRGQTALMLAAAQGNTEVARVLIANNANVRARSNLPPRTPAPAKPSPDVIDVMQAANGNLNAAGGGFTPILFAAREGHIPTLKLLLEAGADPNDKLPNGYSALMLALLNAHFEIAAILLDHGADPNADANGIFPLHQVVWTRNPNHHFNLPPPLPDGDVPSIDVARKLIARGADVNARTEREPRDGYRNWMQRIGSTPFVLAAKGADVELMKVLLEHGADPKLTANDGTTALMAAAGIGYWPAESPGSEAEALEAVKICIAQGIDVNAANRGGFTALHGAAVRGANSIVQLLYDKGAKLDARTKKEKWMALNIADGVFLANTYKATPETAAYLRKLMGISGQRALGARNVYGVVEEQRKSEEKPEQRDKKDDK